MKQIFVSSYFSAMSILWVRSANMDFFKPLMSEKSVQVACLWFLTFLVFVTYKTPYYHFLLTGLYLSLFWNCYVEGSKMIEGYSCLWAPSNWRKSRELCQLSRCEVQKDILAFENLILSEYHTYIYHRVLLGFYIAY